VLVSSSLFAQRNCGVLDPPVTHGIALIVSPITQRAPPTLAEMFLGSAVGSSRLCESGLHQGTLLLQMHRG
jgi:hypothetical protein